MQQTAYVKFVYDRHTRKQGGVTRSKKDRSFKYILKEGCRKLIAFLFTQVGVCALVVAYNIVGAFAFHAIEGVAGDPTPENNAREILNASIISMWNVTNKLNVLHPEQWRAHVSATLKKYQSTLVHLIKHRGYRGIDPLVAWSPPAALMYSLSVYTTIGKLIL